MVYLGSQTTRQQVAATKQPLFADECRYSEVFVFGSNHFMPGLPAQVRL